MFPVCEFALKAIRRFRSNVFRDCEGASLVEYSLLLGLVAAATIGLISMIGVKVTIPWGMLNFDWSCAVPPAGEEDTWAQIC